MKTVDLAVPPDRPVRWRASVVVVGKTLETHVVARTWFDARALAMVELKCGHEVHVELAPDSTAPRGAVG